MFRPYSIAHNDRLKYCYVFDSTMILHCRPMVCRLSVCRFVYCGKRVQDRPMVSIEVDYECGVYISIDATFATSQAVPHHSQYLSIMLGCWKCMSGVSSACVPQYLDFSRLSTKWLNEFDLAELNYSKTQQISSVCAIESHRINEHGR